MIQSITRNGYFYFSNISISNQQDICIIFFPGLGQDLNEQFNIFSKIRKLIEKDQSVDYLQFDYHGCGESIGELADCRLDDLLKSSNEVIKESGVLKYKSVICICMGIGGYIATELFNNSAFKKMNTHYIYLNYPKEKKSILQAKLEKDFLKEEIIDMTKLCPGEDYLYLKDIDANVFYEFSDLGGDFNNLHGQYISKKLIYDISSIDYFKHLVETKNIKRKKIIVTNDFFKRNSFKEKLKEVNIKILNNKGVSFSCFDSQQALFIEIINIINDHKNNLIN